MCQFLGSSLSFLKIILIRNTGPGQSSYGTETIYKALRQSVRISGLRSRIDNNI